MNPIALIEASGATRRAVRGAMATDPVAGRRDALSRSGARGRPWSVVVKKLLRVERRDTVQLQAVIRDD